MSDVVGKYLDDFFNKPLDFLEIRELLADEFNFRGPLMIADSADEFIEKLQLFGDHIILHANILDRIEQEGMEAVRYEQILPNNSRVPSVEWFQFKNSKIYSIERYCDSKNFFVEEE